MRSTLTSLTFLLVAAGASPLAASNEGRVTGLRLEPNGWDTQLTIHLEGGAVRWDDFQLSDPSRVIVDVLGVRTQIPGTQFERLDRGGVSGVRISQHTAEVVRVVVDLQRHSRYTVARVADGIRITLANTGANGFEAWSTGAPAAGRSTAPAPARPAPRTERRITVAFFEADIQDVLASFAEFAGRSIVPGSGVTGKVTAEIRNQPWDVALETILTAHGLAVRELASGILRVDAVEKLREREEQQPLVTESYRINYVPVSDLATSLQALKTERGSIVANSSTNMLIVTDVAAVVNNVRSMIRQLDIRTPQVAIQAKIVFINRGRLEQLGLSYNIRHRNLTGVGGLTPGSIPDGSGVLLGGGLIEALGNAAHRLSGSSLQAITTLILSRDHALVTFLDALQTSNLSEVQAAPLITTLDNQEAEILVGQRTPIRVIDAGTSAGGTTSAPRAAVEIVPTGIRLRVTPTITGDRRILMQLHAERSQAYPTPDEIGVRFETQQGTTRLMVADGETAVIGGLTVTERATNRSGIPLLMDIPIIGALFRNSRVEEQKMDLLIMVTPNIVDDPM